MTFDFILTSHIQKFVEDQYYKLDPRPRFFWSGFLGPGQRKISINLSGKPFEFVCNLFNEFVFVSYNGIRFFTVSFKDYPEKVDSRFLKNEPEAIRLYEMFCNIAKKDAEK